MTERGMNRRRPAQWRRSPTRNPRNRRRMKPGQVLRRASLVALAGAGLWMAFHAPGLRVRRVEVVGAERLGKSRAADLARIPLGQNIFRTNLYRARVAVEQDPLVASASVTRALPDTVRILVRERRPVFVVAYAGRLYEADNSGVLYREVPQPSPQLPVLELRNVGPVRLGERLRPEVAKPALACLRLAARDRLVLRKISVDGPHELWLNMAVPSRPQTARVAGLPGQNLRIRLGRPEELSLKLQDARRILGGRPQILADAQWLDVSCAGRPVYMAQTATGSTSIPERGAVMSSASPAQPVTR
jgi:cell division protein FtsQ